MKIVIQNNCGDFHLSRAQLDKLHEIGSAQKALSEIDKKMLGIIKQNIDGLADVPYINGCYLPLYGMTEEEGMAFRSHPWLIATEEALPDLDHTIFVTQSDYYKIIANTVGIERVLVPESDEFVKGFPQEDKTLFPNIAYCAFCNYYEGDIKPEKDVIFVFGSNTQGRHGKGAAKVALDKFGAIYGQSSGLQGDSYAIVTKDLLSTEQPSISKLTITEQMSTMLQYAIEHPDKKFKLAYRNKLDEKSLCGYTGRELMGMLEEAFDKVGIPDNFYVSSEWIENTGKKPSKNFSRSLF